MKYVVFTQFKAGGEDGIPLTTQTATFHADTFLGALGALDALKAFYEKNNGRAELTHITNMEKEQE